MRRAARRTSPPARSGSRPGSPSAAPPAGAPARRRPRASRARPGSGPACAASPPAGTARRRAAGSHCRSSTSCSGGGAGSCTLSRVKLAFLAACATRTSGCPSNGSSASSPRTPIITSSTQSGGSTGASRPRSSATGRISRAGCPPASRARPATASQSGLGGSRKTRNVTERPIAVPRSMPSRFTGSGGACSGASPARAGPGWSPIRNSRSARRPGRPRRGHQVR